MKAKWIDWLRAQYQRLKAMEIGSYDTIQPYDRAVLWITLILLAFGFVMVYSASVAYAANNVGFNHNPWFFAIRQAIYIAVALIVGLLAFQLPVDFWRRYASVGLIVGGILLVLVLLPVIGHEIKGSKRWINLGAFKLQASEIVKLAVIFFTAHFSVKKLEYMSDWRSSISKILAPMGLVVLVLGGLLLAEPDMGAFAVMVTTIAGILFMAGLNVRIFIALVLAGVMGLVGLVIFEPYRWKRVTGTLDPFADPYGDGFQLSQALMGLGNGELFGQGLGASIAKQSYLPEAHTDFLIAIIGEELGFVGIAIVVVLYVWLIVRAFKIGGYAAKINRTFAALTAQGIGLWLGIQTAINIGVNVGLLPTKGLTLPLMSYGGSGVVINVLALAIVLRIDYENRLVARKEVRS